MKILYTLMFLLIFVLNIDAQTIALWTFDEQEGLYPSSVLSDHSDNDYPLVIGNGGVIIKGKFGNALYPESRPKIKIPDGGALFGLKQLAPQPGRKTAPLSWYNADFCALMTCGEKHLRSEVGFAHVTQTKLNIGDDDWTIEFWFKPTHKSNEKGVVFEIGEGPRGENSIITSLALSHDWKFFMFSNQPAGTLVKIPTQISENKWQHLAFVYNKKNKQLTHFVDGKSQSLPEKATFKKLPDGKEDYMSIGRDGKWNHPLSGAIDELRFSAGQMYAGNFEVPGSFSYLYQATTNQPNLLKGPDLLFGGKKGEVLKLDDRKHLFIDDALLEKYDKGVKFVVNPPTPVKIVLSNFKGAFRKHLNVLEDENGKIRLYTTVEDDYLAVWLSDDGENFYAPVLQNGNYKGHTNVVLHAKVGMGMVFIDPNAPPKERYKYISDYNRRALFLFHSENGLEFQKYKQPVLPFRSASQCNIYYDDQKQVYTSFHRTDFGRSKNNHSERCFVMTETKDIVKPWEFTPLTETDYKTRSVGKRISTLVPGYLDNGPITPGGFSLEYPWAFTPNDSLDQVETDIYVPKAMKYPWAPDTYLAFPIIYYHYKGSPIITRGILGDEDRGRGSGPLENQIAVSRNGKDWHRYPRPVYLGIGEFQGIDFKTAYIAQGMVKKGNEIWQYAFCEPHYHSAWETKLDQRAVIKLKQRLDGFVSLDSPYEKEVYAETKPFTFKGNKLHLNVDTDAAGYIQVGFMDENGNDIPGFSVDDCIYINGDFVDTQVEYIKNRDKLIVVSNKYEEDQSTTAIKAITSTDLSALEGKTVKLIFRMRGSKLYALQFSK